MNTLAFKLKHSLKTVQKNESHFLFQLGFFNAFMQVSIEYVYISNQHQQCRQTFHGRLSKYKIFLNLAQKMFENQYFGITQLICTYSS